MDKPYRYEVKNNKLYVYSGRNLIGIYNREGLIEHIADIQKEKEKWEERLSLLEGEPNVESKLSS